MEDHPMDRGSLDGRIERAKEAALGPHEGKPTVADLVGEAAGGISGVVAGAAVGSLAGPIGTVIGGIAGAMGGWWAGRAVSEAIERLTEDDETYYRKHYMSVARVGGVPRRYDDARPAYHLGHIAGLNPEYQGREFEEIEAELQRGWNDDLRTRYGEWDAVRGFVEAAFIRQARSGERTPKEPGREIADDRARDEGPSGLEPSGGDRPADESSASKHRSIPRGTDETTQP